MKYGRYYKDVVRRLERIEARRSHKAGAPAYLIWQDEDGPSMIVGPGIEWHRGDGPPPARTRPAPKGEQKAYAFSEIRSNPLKPAHFRQETSEPRTAAALLPIFGEKCGLDGARGRS